MAWRDAFLRCFGPGLLGGLTFGRWLRQLRDNRFAVAPSCLMRAMAITFHSANNSAMAWLEKRRFAGRVQNAVVQPPLFVLGHWRSGTTHLHNLLTVDERFAFPNNYEVMFPHTFLTTQGINSPLMNFFFPRHRPMDNVEWTLRSPQEDEFAILLSSFLSPCMGWIWPKRRDHYDQYLTLRGATQQEIAQWQEALLGFLKKLTFAYGRPLILKSPPHTCRIRLLLQLFPQAKFVHIRRNPYAVFPSARKTFLVAVEMHRLQRPRLDDLDEWILRQYRTMYDVFFEERGLVPAGHFHEVGYEQLEQDPIGEMRRLYEVLGLPEFNQVEPALRRYVDSIAGYSKNEFPELPAELRNRIAERWRPCFEEWGYPT